jgi:hypothetical protein
VGPAFFIILVVVIIIVAAIIGHLQAEKRRKELLQWAGSQGLSFVSSSNYAMDERFSSFSCLRQGSNRYAYNIMEGKHRHKPVCAFDYHYETYSTDAKGNRQTHNHYFSAVIVDSGLPLKPLFIREEGFFDKVAEFVGFDDIDFESAEFSRQFYVKAPDRKWAFDVLHQATMEFLLQAPRFALEFQGPHVLAYRSGTFAPTDFSAALLVIDGIFERMPNSLIQEMKGAH